MQASLARGLLATALGIGALLMSAGTSPGIAAGGPMKQGVKTVVTWPVTACSNGFCCVAGDLQATFNVTLNSDGTARVKTTLKAVNVNGCGKVGGHVSATTTVVVGQLVTISGPLNYNNQKCEITEASAVASFVVNSDGSVSVQSMGLFIYCFSPDPG
jgi:hypothetical protein